MIYSFDYLKKKSRVSISSDKHPASIFIFLSVFLFLLYSDEIMQRSHELSVTETENDSEQVNSPDLRSVSEEQSTSDSKREIPKLSLQIPSKPVIFTNYQGGEGSHQSQSSSKSGASSPGSILRGLSFKKKNNTPDGEKSRLLNPNPQAVAGSSTLSRVMWETRCSSLSGPAFYTTPSVTTPASARTATENQRSYKGAVNKKVSRSFSVPGRNVVIVRSPSFAATTVQNQPDLPGDQIAPASPGCDNDEEIPEDEAICRICFEACEEGNTLKMECSCKGALQLIHEDCAVKWFSIKRNKICDVCGQEVLNLPVTLLRISSDVQRNNGPVQIHQTFTSRSISAWQDFVVLAIISIICYFFFIEQLLIQDLKTRAVVIAAPFAFALGLVASMLAVFLAIREYVWTYAAVEFAFVAVILCIFYNVLHLKAVYAVLLSSVLGFSFALSLNAFYIHFFYWRIRVAESSTNV